MVSTLHAHLAVPVTCKIRLLYSEEETLRLAMHLQNSGCSLLTVHGRTKEMIKQKIGPVDFDMIKKIKQHVQIPVFANGGVETLADVLRIIEYTGVDGVMVSEGILSNPALFYGEEPAPTSIGMARQYLRLVNDMKSSAAKAAARPHLFKILFKELTVHIDVRDFLGSASNFEAVSRIPDMLEAARESMGPAKAQAAYDAVPTWYKRFQKPGEACDTGCDDGKDRPPSAANQPLDEDMPAESEDGFSDAKSGRAQAEQEDDDLCIPGGDVAEESEYETEEEEEKVASV